MEQRENFNAIAGSKMEEVNLLLMRQLMAAVEGKPVITDEEVSLKLVAGALLVGISPRNELEGMLAAQLVALHQTVMDDYAAARTSPAEDTQQMLNADAMAKSRVFAELVGALMAVRSLGAQNGH